MKILAAIFASILLLSALLGFGLNVLPILSGLGKVAALLALVGLTVTVVAYVAELLPQLAFKVEDIQP